MASDNRRLRVLVTRPEPDASDFADKLAAAGIEPILCPLMTIETNSAALNQDGVGALAFTSANGVRAYALKTALRTIPAYVVGDATRKAAQEAGLQVAATAAGDVGSLAAAIIGASERAQFSGGVLHVAGAHRAGDLAAMLSAGGVAAGRAVLYEAVAIETLPAAVIAILAQQPPDWVAIYSPRTAAMLCSLLKKSHCEGVAAAMNAACLSPQAAAAMEPLQWRKVAIAASPSTFSLIDLILAEVH